MTDYYSQDLLEEALTPANWQEWEAEPSQVCHNASCGDSVAIQVQVDQDRISHLVWHGHGCALSKAAGSLISQQVLGMNVSEVRQIDLAWIQQLTGLTDLSPGRVKCVLLFISCLQRKLGTDDKASGTL